MPSLLVVILCLKYFRGPVELIHSVVSDLPWTPYIVDNWRQNRGVSESWTLGILEAQDRKFDYVIICNDDILFAPYVLDGLVVNFENSPESVQMVTPRNCRDVLGAPEDVLVHETGPFEIAVPQPDFSAFMVRPDFVDRFGPFDPNFWPAYFEDNDMHYRIKLAGYEAVKFPHLWHYHIGSKTQNLDPSNVVTSPPQFRANQAYYVRKWGGPPGEEVYKTPFGNPEFTFKEF